MAGLALDSEQLRRCSAVSVEACGGGGCGVKGVGFTSKPTAEARGGQKGLCAC